jgi:hypothetical protein
VVSQGGEGDRLALSGAGLRTWPRPRPGQDAGSLFELVPGPLIELRAAGLRVGQAMVHARRRGSSPLAAEQLAADEAHAQQLPKDLGGTRRA